MTLTGRFNAVTQEYCRLRSLGWRSSDAMSAARTNVRFAELEADGLVRVGTDPDECMSADDLVGEGASEQARKEILDRANYDGVWVYYTEHLDPVDGWTVVDSCGGFIGDDWRDSGYDVDMKQAAIDALLAVDLPLLEGWV